MGHTHRHQLGSVPSADPTSWGRSSEETLTELLNHELWKDRFDGCSEVGRYCGPVPVKPVRKPAVGRVFVFWEYCRPMQTNYGGGIGPGFTHVDNSLELISKIIRSDSLNWNATDRLAKQIIKPIMKDIIGQRALLRDFFLTNSTDEELESIFRIWARPDVIIIQKYGEIENPVPLGAEDAKGRSRIQKISNPSR